MKFEINKPYYVKIWQQNGVYPVYKIICVSETMWIKKSQHIDKNGNLIYKGFDTPSERYISEPFIQDGIEHGSIIVSEFEMSDWKNFNKN